MTAPHPPFLPDLDLSEWLYREAVRRELPREVRGFPIDLARRDFSRSFCFLTTRFVTGMRRIR